MNSLGKCNKIINIFRCISKGENDLQYLRNSLQQVNKLNLNIYQIYAMISDCNVMRGNMKGNIKGIYKENVIMFLERGDWERREVLMEEGLIEKFIYLNSEKGDCLNIRDLNRMLIGKEMVIGYVCEYIREELKREIEDGVCEILMREIDMVKSLSCLLEELMCCMNKNEVNVNEIYNDISERSGIITVESFKRFCKKYYCEDISDEEIVTIIKKLSLLKSDKQLTFKDFNRLMSLNKYTYYDNNYNQNKAIQNEILIHNPSINELEHMLRIYFIDIALSERIIHNAKETFLHKHNDFSINKLFNYLNLENNTLFSINNSFLQLSFSKLGIYLTNNDLIFLLKRIEHFYKGDKTYTKLFTLIMPITLPYIEHDITDVNSFLLDSTKIALKELIEIIVQEERKINVLKQETSKYFNHWLLEKVFTNILRSVNRKEHFLNFNYFYIYAKHNDIIGNNKNNFTSLHMELLYRRLNKSNNNKLTLHEISNELQYLN